eukprot:2132918-Prymnesium_polylepis.1
MSVARRIAANDSASIGERVRVHTVTEAALGLHRVLVSECKIYKSTGAHAAPCHSPVGPREPCALCLASRDA